MALGACRDQADGSPSVYRRHAVGIQGSKLPQDSSNYFEPTTYDSDISTQSNSDMVFRLEVMSATLVIKTAQPDSDDSDESQPGSAEIAWQLRWPLQCLKPSN
jgi:hypothetical protein